MIGSASYFVLRKPVIEPVISTIDNNTRPIQPQIIPTQTTDHNPPSSHVAMSRYQSSYGFSIDYPTDWRLEPPIIEENRTKAEEVAGKVNFEIYSYTSDYYRHNPGARVPQDEIKIEVWISNNVYESLDEWIDSLKLKKISTENISIDGKTAKKVLFDDDLGPYLAVYYLDGKRKVIFYAYPSDTKYSQEFDAIVKTFRFTN